MQRVGRSRRTHANVERRPSDGESPSRGLAGGLDQSRVPGLNARAGDETADHAEGEGETDLSRGVEGAGTVNMAESGGKRRREKTETRKRQDQRSSLLVSSLTTPTSCTTPRVITVKAGEHTATAGFLGRVKKREGSSTGMVSADERMWSWSACVLATVRGVIGPPRRGDDEFSSPSTKPSDRTKLVRYGSQDRVGGLIRSQ